MCEGLTKEELLAENAATIARRGYLLQGVAGPGGPGDPSSWVYTAGLLDAADHPEMIVAGLPANAAAGILSDLADDVLEGERFRPGDTIHWGSDAGVLVGSVVAVHPIQYEVATFAVWHELKRAGVLRAPALRAVQIVLPDALGPIGAARRQPDLADPATRLDPVEQPVTNRAARRRALHRRRDPSPT